MRYVKHKEINAQKWDACLMKIEHCHFYALYDYLSNICSWDAIILEKEDHYQTVIPLPFKSKFGLKYIYQPFFCQQLGVFTLKTLNKKETEAIFKIIRSRFLFGSFQWNLSTPHHPDIISEEAPNYLLDLSTSYQEVRKGYNSNRKRNIKKNSSYLDKISCSSNPEELEVVIYDFEKQLGERFPEVKSEHYENILKGLKKSSTVRYYIYSIIDGNDRLASSLFVNFNNRLIYLLGYTKPEFSKLGVNTLLFNAIIENQVEKRVLLDFEGSKIPGIAKFYQSFGAKNCPYYKHNLKLNLLFFMKRLG